MTRSPEKIAWITLIVAQFVCLFIGGAGLATSKWFLFDSAVGLQTEIKVGRGTVGVRLASSSDEEAVRLNRSLQPRETVIIDPVTQGTIVFVDTSEQDLVIANMTIFGGSEVRLAQATRPRFHLGDGEYKIRLDNLEGRIEVQIPFSLPRQMVIEIKSRNGTVTLTESGFYTIISTQFTLTAQPRVGNAQLSLPDGRADSILVGYHGTADSLTDSLTISLNADEVFDNPFFLNALEAAPTPENWGCEHGTTTVGAEYYLTTFEGRRSVYISRPDPTLGPGATLCKQFLGTNGANVIPYSSLRIRATFNVRSHSLSICGVQATECVLMLRMYYKNEYGQDMEWIHGFYSFNYTPGDGTPIQCGQCVGPHEQVTPGNWFTYESPNLMNFQEGFRPTTITRIEFYASGHGYEVAVAEVSLIGER